MAWGGMAGANLQQLTSDIIAHFGAKKAARKEWKHYKQRYQVMVSDLKQAGLNPMLAYGSAGSVPDIDYGRGGGGAAPAVEPGARVDLERAEREVASAQAAKTRQDTLTGQAQQALIEQERETSAAQKKVLDMTIPVRQQEALEAAARRDRTILDSRLLKFSLPGAEAKARFWENVNRVFQGVRSSALGDSPEELRQRLKIPSANRYREPGTSGDPYARRKRK